MHNIYGNMQDLYKSSEFFSDINFPMSLHQSRLEGFLAGTLIKTVDGYIPIEQLVIGDVVSGAYGDQKIEYLKLNKFDQYVLLQIDQEIVKVAFQQQIYKADGTLLFAQDLKIGDCLSNGNVVYAKEIIDEPCLCVLKKKI